MADNSTILEKLDGLVARFEEISTLITDPAVIADLQGGAILTNRCPNPKYKQFTLVKETEL